MNHDLMKFFAISLPFWIGLFNPAAAGEARIDGKDKGQAANVTRTEQWLAIQREGRAAGKLLPIPGAEAGLSYRRYMDSFAPPTEQSRLRAPSPAGQK